MGHSQVSSLACVGTIRVCDTRSFFRLIINLGYYNELFSGFLKLAYISKLGPERALEQIECAKQYHISKRYMQQG